MAYEKKFAIRAIIRNILETLRYRITVTDSDISLQTEILHIRTKFLTRRTNRCRVMTEV